MADQDDASKTLYVSCELAESKEDGPGEAEKPVQKKRPRKNLTYSVNLVDLRTLGDSPARKCYEDLLEGSRAEIAKNPEDASGSYELCCIALCELGRLKEAKEAARQAIKLNPKYAGAHRNRAVSKYELGLYKTAIADLNKAIDLDPEDAIAYERRAVVKATLERLPEAIDDFTEAIKLDPMDYVAYYNRGLARKELGLDKEADQDFEQAKRLEQK